MDRIEDLVANLSAAEAKNILKLVEELDRRDREGGAISTFVANPKQKDIFNTKKKVRTVMGGNRCLGGEQEVYDPVYGGLRRVDSINEPFHVFAWDGTSTVIARASAPFRKPKADLYRLTMDDGTTIVTSPYHLFWGLQGWQECRLYVTRYESVLPHPATNWGIQQSTHPQDAGHCRSVAQVDYLRNDDVWDFEVYEYHNYFIGDVLSHNSGKSHCAAFEVACHATGIYPDWWEGYRYTEAIDMGVISPDTGQMLKTSQRKLMGPPDSFGTGFIPKDLILELHERPQTNGCLDFSLVKHASGGTTRMYFMTTQQTLKSFMGFMWRLAWFDEEPPWEYFDETRFRMLDKGGNILLSFYPPEGQTELISFLEEMEKKNPEYYESWFLEWADNPTLDPETVEMMEKTTPDWLKESRKYGRTGAGEGRCFPYSRDIYVCEPFEIERHWRQIAGFDVGFGHYTGAVCIAFDDMSDTAYVYKEYFSKEQLPSIHASALRRWGDVEFCIDTSSKRRSPTDGKNLFKMYSDEGLRLRDAETRGGSVESSIAMINTMLSERRLFVFSTCPNLIKQMGGYRRVQDKQGKWSVLAKDNDLCLGGENEILTKEFGWVRIDSMVGKEFTIMTPLGWQHAHSVHGTGRKPATKSTLENGLSFTHTFDHEFLSDGHGFSFALQGPMRYLVSSAISNQSTGPIQTLWPEMHTEGITSQEEIGESEVYDLTVDVAHCFFLRCGIVASNCDPLRYATMWLNEARTPGIARVGPPTPKIVEWSPVDPRIGI